jgi:hypothetical protein
MDEYDRTSSYALEEITRRMRAWFETFGEGDLPSPERVRDTYRKIHAEVFEALDRSPPSS